MVRWVVRLSTWESEEKQRRSRKEEKKKMGQMLQTLKHTHTHPHTHAHTRRQRYTHIPLASSFVRSFVRSSGPPAVVVARAGWASLPPPLASGTLITRLHGTCAVPCFSRSHPQVPIKITAFFSFFFPWLLVASIHLSIHPSVRPSSPPLSL